METWVIMSMAVVIAAAICAQPLSRLRKPKKYDKLKICLGISVILVAVIVAYSRPIKAISGGGIKYVRPISNLYRSRGGAQCTVRRPQIGSGYKPYVVPDDLAVGGGYPEAIAPTPYIPAIEPTYAVPATVPATPAIINNDMDTEVVVGGTLRLTGEF